MRLSSLPVPPPNSPIRHTRKIHMTVKSPTLPCGLVRKIPTRQCPSASCCTVDCVPTRSDQVNHGASTLFHMSEVTFQTYFPCSIPQSSATTTSRFRMSTAVVASQSRPHTKTGRRPCPGQALGSEGEKRPRQRVPPKMRLRPRMALRNRA